MINAWGWAFALSCCLLLSAAAPRVRGQPPVDPVNTNATQWPTWLGMAPPLFTAEDDALHSCWSLYPSLSGANCTKHASTILPTELLNCALSATAGTLVLRRTGAHGGDVPYAAALAPHTSEQLLGTAVYRLRVTSAAGVWLLEPAYCRQDLALASYELPGPGRYSIEVLLLYSSFAFDAPQTSTAVSSPWAGYLTLTVAPATAADAQQPGAPPTLVASEDWRATPDTAVLEPDANTQPLLPHAAAAAVASDGAAGAAQPALPPCRDAGPLPGRWVPRVWPAPDMAHLLTTCIWGDSVFDCTRAERHAIHTGAFPGPMVWQPHGCRLRRVEGLDPSLPLYASDASVAAATPPPPPPPPAADPLAWVPAVQEHYARLHRAQQRRTHHHSLLGGLDGGAATAVAAAAGAGAAAAGAAAAAAAEQPPIAPAACLPPGRTVCFVGDSHARFLYNSLVLWASGYSLTVNNTAKELLPSPATHYYKVLWGADWPQRGAPTEPEPLVGNCTDVLVNFGQWPASYRSGYAPFSVAQYEQQLLAVRRRMLALRRTYGIRVYWVTTCMSSLKARLEAAGIDWRTDPLLLLYNRLAAETMAGTSAAAARERSQAEAHTAAANAAAAAAGGAAGGAAGAGASVEEAGASGGGSGGVRHLAEAGAAQQVHTQEQQDDAELQLAQGGASAGEAWWLPGRLGRRLTDLADRLLWRRRRRQQEQASSGSGVPAGGAAAAGTGPSATEAAAAALRAAAAAEAGDAWAIPLIDTWSSSRILHEATCDGNHYANTGMVGSVQLTAVLHALCPRH